MCLLPYRLALHNQCRTGGDAGLMKKRNIFALASTGGIRVANAGLGVINTVLLARILGIEEFGQYAFVYAVILVVSIPARIGLPQLVIRETSYAMTDNRSGHVFNIWGWTTRMGLGISALITVIFVAAAILLQGRSSGAETLLAASLLVPLISLGNLRGAALRGLGKVVLGQLPELVLRPAFFTLFLCWFGFVQTEVALTAAQALLWHTAAAGLAFLIGTVFLYRERHKLGHREDSAFGGKVALLSAFSLGAAAGLSVLNNNVDIIMIRAFMNDADVGLYRPAVTMGGLVLFGQQIITTLITPRIAGLYRQKEMPRLQSLLRKSARFSFGCSVLVFVIFAAFGRALLAGLFGPAYLAGYVPLLVLSASHVINASFGSAANLLAMSGHEADTLRAIGVSTLVNIAANTVLVVNFGITGAAFGTLISIVLYKALLTRAIRTKLGLRASVF